MNVRTRQQLKRVPGLRPAVVNLRLAAGRAGALWGRSSLLELPPVDIVRFAYNAFLRREPDEGAIEQFVPALAQGTVTVDEFLDGIRTSEEFRVRTEFSDRSLLRSLHLSRIEFILGLPRAAQIVDLGGSATYSEWGALVLMGYPYDFESLTIVDLPSDERHPLYQSDTWDAVQSEHGPVRYELRSMTDLSFAADSSVDLVYSGQSIEHVTQQDAALTVREVWRVLRPGGWFALDTPNAAVCRLQTPDFIDPDHKHEYLLSELETLLESAGFAVRERKGLNLGTRSVASGAFDIVEFASHPGVYSDAEACYLLAVLAQKPPA